MVHLFTPLRIREVTFKNRIAVSPMCQYSSQDGFANEWHLVHLGSRAVGGAGLVLSEATAVSPDGRISAADLGIWKDDHVHQLQRITHFILQQGSVPGIQLAHAGRKASHTEPWTGDKLIPESQGGWKTIAPSALPFSEESDTPIALTHEGIARVVADFRTAAERAIRANFKVVEIHAAHGYLINQFLSPLTNKRTDIYGGSYENRIRLLLEIVAAVRGVWPEQFPLFVRISATDWRDDGWTLEDSIALASVLKKAGVDLVDCSSGGIVPGVKVPASPGYQVQFAEEIRKQTGIYTGAVGIIVRPEQAEEIVARGQADLVLMAREFLRDPYFPLRAARELDYDITWPVQYERAKRKKA
ncbi:MAG TPA: NADPH dehydrogenase NamA [Bacteroidetes bacterium]|jgi:2,4-dienoyl-CoA reductase-like NADH-dependent reductase (Old Yellow Enzyme family)|nr:NADPH dehydrogenase NamA [Bacteroidota bacterium]